MTNSGNALLHELVRSHLAASGRADVLECFTREAGLASSSSPSSAAATVSQREQIRRTILHRQVPRAVSLINDSFPGFLDGQNQEVLFDLRVQHFTNLTSDGGGLQGLIAYVEEELADYEEAHHQQRLGEALSLFLLPHPEQTELYLRSARETSIRVNAALAGGSSAGLLDQAVRLAWWARRLRGGEEDLLSLL